MRKFLMLFAVVALIAAPSFAGVAKESFKAGKFAGKESVKAVKFSGKKAVKALKFGAKVLF